MKQNEVILEVAGEGGGLTIYGIRQDSGWLFSRQVIDQTAILLDEPEIRHESVTVTTWPDALALLDRYPWPRLYPMVAHPDFRQAILSAVIERLDPQCAHSENCIERWRELCGDDGNSATTL